MLVSVDYVFIHEVDSIGGRCPVRLKQRYHHDRRCSRSSSSSSSCCGINSGGPLSGVRVLDLTRVLAGPFATMILGDLGAEIIKVESVGVGDGTRMWGPPFVGKESAYFLSVNRNKQSIAIDLKKPDGIEIMEDLVRSSDILIENFVPGSLDRLGLGYESLSEIAPQLIYCSITGFGRTGPYRDRPGYDVIAASYGGLMGVTGPDNGEPCKVGVAMTDLATGLYAHGAVMAALLERHKTGKGQRIDCNLLSTQVSCMVNLASNYLNGGIDGRRLGTAHESIVPYQAFATKDGFLTVGGGSNDQFRALCERMNLEHLITDKRYTSNALRVKNRKSLLSTLSEFFQTKSNKDWIKLFEGAAFPYGPVNSLSESYEDPQVIHNNMVQEIDHSTAGVVKLVGPAVQFSQLENKIRSPPPTLGQHTEHILLNTLGYTKEKVMNLKDMGVVQS
ncbi:unnamed protein product, partial [Meganyctiphanes norvegica]